ncbi:MAG TPA: hypothetical protein VMJ10_02855, partial [Kofleriaceae bacterium]|nr:hypothetical protein [Kofleriaceae bacterium]
HSLVVLGTPMYMSPEQCKSSAKVDARSDIYALGCMLFELVCGRPPFEGDSGELIAKHQLVPPPEAREVAADVPAPLSKLIAEMLAKTPEERPQSMESVLDALDVCEGKGADATKTTALPASTRLGSRKLWLGAGGAIAIGVIAGVIATRGGSTRAPAPALVSDARIEPEAVHETPIAPLPAPPPAPPADATVAQAGGCDADDLKQKGLDLEASGLHAAALAEFEQALACKPEGRVAQYAFMAACNAGNLAKARQYYRDMTPDAQSRFLQMCIRRNITKDQLEGAEPAPALAPRPKPAATAAPPQPAPVATCDPEDLKQRGLDNESQGKHVPALAAFEAALACKPDPRVVQYAFMAACNAGNHAKAKVYYRKMTADARERFVQMCMRRDIPKDELEAP